MNRNGIIPGQELWLPGQPMSNAKLGRVTGRFGVIAGPPTGRRPHLLQDIFPMTNIDEIMADWRVELGTTESIGAGLTGTFDAITLPNDERWEVTVLRFNRASGDNVASSLTIEDPTGASVIIDTFTATANGNVSPGTLPLKLDPGSKLQIGMGGAGVAASTFTVTVWRGNFDFVLG